MLKIRIDVHIKLGLNDACITPESLFQNTCNFWVLGNACKLSIGTHESMLLLHDHAYSRSGHVSV
jgi:hypothetical protein